MCILLSSHTTASLKGDVEPVYCVEKQKAGRINLSFLDRPGRSLLQAPGFFVYSDGFTVYARRDGGKGNGPC